MSTSDRQTSDVESAGAGRVAVDRTSLLRQAGRDRRGTQSYSSGMRRPATRSAASTYGTVYSSMPQQRDRAHTHHHGRQRHHPHGDAGSVGSGSWRRRRHHAVSFDIQDPRERRMSRSNSEHAIARGIRLTRGGSVRSVSTQDAAGMPVAGLAGDSEFAGAQLVSVSEKDEDVSGSASRTEEGDDGGGSVGSASSEGEGVLSRFSAFALTINFIIGVGVLDLPYIFHEAGIAACIVLLALSTAGSSLSAMFLLESQSRGVMRSKSEGSAENAVDHWFKLELSEMCEIFVGGWFKYVYLFIFYIFQLSTLWSYAAVFSQTGASIISPALGSYESVNRTGSNLTCSGAVFDPDCATLYYILLSIFAVCEVIMTVVGLKEQAVVQTILAIYRFAAIFVMLVIAFIGFGLGLTMQGEPMVPDARYFVPDGIPGALPSIIFAQLLQMAIPGVVEVMPGRQHANVHFLAAFGTTGFSYILLSTVLSIYLACSIQSPVTLNFNSFTGFMSAEDFAQAGLGIQVIVDIAKYFVILFPCLDLFSAFSLNAIVLANNLLDVFPDSVIDKVGFQKLKVGCCIFVATVPIILAFVDHDLVTIINIAGTTGMLLMFFFPGMLQYCSIKYYSHKSPDTPFTPKHGTCLRCLFGQGAALTMMVVGWLLFIFSVVVLIVPAPDDVCNDTVA